MVFFLFDRHRILILTTRTGHGNGTSAASLYRYTPVKVKPVSPELSLGESACRIAQRHQISGPGDQE